MKDEKTNLLNDLLAAMGYAYLSDLRFQSLDKRVIENIIEEQYTMKDWNEAISYITNLSKEFATPQEAKTFLMSTAKD